MKVSKDARSAIERIVTIVVLVALALAVLWGSIVLIWRGAQLVPPDAARVWALLATALFPIAVWTGWWSGHTEERGRLAGFDKAIDKMFGGLSKASELGTKHTRRIQAAREPPIIVLPDVEIVPRQLSSGGNIVEL